MLRLIALTFATATTFQEQRYKTIGEHYDLAADMRVFIVSRYDRDQFRDVESWANPPPENKADHLPSCMRLRSGDTNVSVARIQDYSAFA